MELVEDVDEAVQLHDVNDHWLELEMIAGDNSMSKAKLRELVDEVDDVQLHDANVHWLELEMVEEPIMRNAKLDELVEDDADQLHERNARVLEFATVKGPVKYIGIVPFLPDAEAKTIDRCIKKVDLFTSEKFTNITTFP